MFALFSAATIKSVLYHFFHIAPLNDFSLTLCINLRLGLSSVTLTNHHSDGPVPKSRGDKVVRMWIQLKRCD